MLLGGRTRISSRGQVVIPVALRQAAGITEGDEIEVLFDGTRLMLYPAGRATSQLPAGSVGTGMLLREARSGYEPVARQWLGAVPGRPGALSQVWADRIRALAAIKQLRAEFTGLDGDELRSESRRELDRRTEQ